jgi:hypothetical protein
LELLILQLLLGWLVSPLLLHRLLLMKMVVWLFLLMQLWLLDTLVMVFWLQLLILECLSNGRISKNSLYFMPLLPRRLLWFLLGLMLQRSKRFSLHDVPFLNRRLIK